MVCGWAALKSALAGGIWIWKAALDTARTEAVEVFIWTERDNRIEHLSLVELNREENPWVRTHVV